MLAVPMFVTFAALTLLAPRSDTVKEDETGLRFHTEMLAPGGSADDRVQHLLGTGCREKFWINVYGYALYIDQVQAYAELSELLSGAARGKLSEKDVKRINSAEISKTLRLVMVRDVDGEDMREAFEDYLGARLKHHGSAEDRRRSFANLAKFRAYFADDVADGTELVFAWRSGTRPGDPGTLTTKIAGRIVGTLAAPDMTWALFDCYIGKDPISEDSVEDMADALPTLLRAGKSEAEAEAERGQAEEG